MKNEANLNIRQIIISERTVFIALFAYVLFLLFFCSKMSPLYPINEWADVNLYFNIGKAIFNGKVPYTEAFDHKGPLIFFLYSLGYLISNTSFLGMYFIECLFWMLMVFTAYIMTRLYFDKIYAFLIAVLFPSLVLSHTLNGGSAEEFILVFEVVSLYLFVRYFRERNASVHNSWYMLIHGLMCSMTLFIKLNLVIFWLFPLLAVFLNLMFKKEYRNLSQNLVAFILGLSIVAVPILLYFSLNGALGDAWNTYIVLNKSYSNPGSLFDVTERLFSYFYQQLRFGSLSFVLILAGAFYFPMKYLGNIWGKISIMLSFAGLYMAIFVSSYYVDYYYLPLYAFGLLGVICICHFLKGIPGKWPSYLIIALLSLYLGISQRNLFGYEAGKLLKGEIEDNVPSGFSEIISREKDATLMNLGLDLGNLVFTQTGIVPSVKYFISPNLTYETYPQMRNDQTEYIKNKEVQFIILSEVSPNYKYFRELPALNDNYSVVSTFLESGATTYYLYKRKD